MIKNSGSVLWHVSEWLIQKEPEGILTEMRKKSNAIRRMKEADKKE
jgi:hypothetical protein